MHFFTTTTTFPLLLASSALAADVGASGDLSSLDAGLQGTVMVKDADTLEITGYTLEDASAPALYWWGSETSDLSSGFRISSKQVTSTASDETLSVALDAGKSADQFAYVGLWCERLDVNFGQARLVAGGGEGDETKTTDAAGAGSTGAADSTTTQNGAAGKVGAGAVAVAAAFFAAFLA